MEKQLIKFEETETSIPFIKVKHNNIEFNLIVDTGCTISCIDKDILDLLVHTPTGNQTPGLIYANGGNDEPVCTHMIPLNIGGIDFEEEFNAIDFGGMYRDVKDSFGITVRGLLGSEFMYRNHLILDFNNSIIRYTDGRQTTLDFGESEQPETTCEG